MVEITPAVELVGAIAVSLMVLGVSALTLLTLRNEEPDIETETFRPEPAEAAADD